MRGNVFFSSIFHNIDIVIITRVGKPLENLYREKVLKNPQDKNLVFLDDFRLIFRKLAVKHIICLGC